MMNFVRICLLLFLCNFNVEFARVRGEYNERSERGVTIEDSQSESFFYYQQPEYPRDCKEVQSQCSTSSSEPSGVFVIRPDGFTHPFEVSCDNNSSGGWTVIQRRTDGPLFFNRKWNDYADGFGFLLNEFWLGNEKLSYLTNQGVYELRIDITLSNGSSFFVAYDSFQISDEWSQYALVSLGQFSGNASFEVFECPSNMVYVNCTCEPTCDDPNGRTSCFDNDCIVAETCVCADGLLKKGNDCVMPSECGCFVAELDLVIPNGEAYVKAACSEKCTCQNGHFSCSSDYACSPNAECTVKNGTTRCYCIEGYAGDGETCDRVYKDCYDAYNTGQRQNGVYLILPDGWPKSSFEVYCDMTTSGGGWTVFHRRVDGVTDFYRNWTSYKVGFGSVLPGKDFWLGNEKLYYLTNVNQRTNKLRVDIVTSGGSPKYEEYASFRIDGESSKYRLVDLGTASGDAGDGLYHSDGHQFSTYDEDNDECRHHNCAERHRGGWWYAYYWCNLCYGILCHHFQYTSRCHTLCAVSNLNGDYNGANGENISWYHNNYCNLNSAEMKIRPVS